MPFWTCPHCKRVCDLVFIGENLAQCAGCAQREAEDNAADEAVWQDGVRCCLECGEQLADDEDYTCNECDEAME